VRSSVWDFDALASMACMSTCRLSSKRCVVPLQDELPSSVLMGILRQADVSTDEFERLL
jgi:hypothetical protein